MIDTLVAPLQERMDDWKKVAVQLDKEHSKGIHVYTQYRTCLVLARIMKFLVFNPLKPTVAIWVQL